MIDSRYIHSRDRIIFKHYKVKETITGGMGNVYLCTDTEQDNLPVVLKTIKNQYLSDMNVRAQFLLEAAVWIEIGWHPNVVQAYRAEYDSTTQEFYLVLEMIPSLSGEKNPTLRSWLLPGAGISIEKTLKVLLDVARGMKFITTKVPGLVHRDLKPENIFIGPDDHARVSDFGLVTIPELAFENLSKTILRDFKHRSRPVGTPHYMSPEQWRNRNVRISSDIYSFGCIAIEMLTGDYPVRDLSIKNIAEDHIKGEALIRLKESNLPAALIRFLSRCIDKESRYRFQTWCEVESGIIKLYDVLLHQDVEPENIWFDVSQKTQQAKGDSILLIGEAFLDIQEYQAAIKCFEKARAIGKLQDYSRLVAQSEANVGLAFLMTGQHERGISHYQRAGNQTKQGVGTNTSGKISRKSGNSLDQSSDIARPRKNITKVIELTREIG
jgi:eukaryotic-like serine/threonine-protein kinase